MSDNFEKDREEDEKSKSSLPLPFHDKDEDKEPKFGHYPTANDDGEDEGGIKGKKGHFGPVDIGKSDKEPNFGKATPGNSGGMIIGPEHSIFTGDHSSTNETERYDQTTRPSLFPSGSIPMGARFDPVTPMAPVRGPNGEYLFQSGEPDSDELAPPGANNPRLPGFRPPRGGPSGSGGFNGSGAPFFK